MIFRIACRNVFRQKRRTLLTTLTMFGGFVLCSFSIAWMDGSYANVIDMFTRNQLGHIQVHEREYLDQPSLYRTIRDYRQVGESIASVDRVLAWAPRVYAPGLASIGEKTAGVRIIGIDPQREMATTRFDRKVTGGKPLERRAARQVLLGAGLANRLDAVIGTELVVVSEGADGSIANDLYTVRGFVDSGDPMSDQTALYLHIDDAQELLVLGSRVHEIAVVANSIRNLYELSARIATAINRPELVVEPWQEFARSFYDAMKADQQGNWIAVGIITMLVAIGVLNTVLMSVLERQREYGLLRAIGTAPGQIFVLVIAEVVVMAGISVAAGALLSYGLNYAMSLRGIPLPLSVDYGGVTFSHMYTEINLRSYTIPLACVALSAAVMAVLPALRAARTRPAVAMRMH